MKFREGMTVIIERCKTVLQNRCNDQGGWFVLPPVHGIRYWNEQEMKIAKND